MTKYVSLAFPLSGENQEIFIAQIQHLPFNSIWEREEDIVVYFEESLLKSSIVDELRVLCEDKNIVMPTAIKEEYTNWNSKWESSFDPIRVEDICTIRASFHERQGKTQHEIIIDPKMSFGTGHHETTYMMIDLMSKIEMKGKRVLDYGCGTSVLAILAAMMKASDVLAIDNDGMCIINSKENLRLNNIDNVRLAHGEIITVDEEFDIILANINRNILLDSVEKLASLQQPNMLLMLSGILRGDKDKILQSYSEYYTAVESVDRGEWSAIRLRRI